MYELVRMTSNGTPQQWAFRVLVNGTDVGRFVGGVFYPENEGDGLSVCLMSFLCGLYSNRESAYWQYPNPARITQRVGY